jgi:signal transduction histidine kinase
MSMARKRHGTHWRFAWLICLMGLLACYGALVQAATLQAGAGRVSLAGQMTLLHDPSGKLTIEDVTAAATANQFKPLPGGLSAGYVSGDVWLRFDLTRAANAPTDWWLEVPNPLIDEVSLFVPKQSGHQAKPAYTERRAGEQVAAQLRDSIPYRQVVFRLTIADGSTSTYFLRLRSVNALVTEPTLWSDRAFAANTSREDAIFGGLFMLLAVITLTGFMVGGTVRDRGVLASSGFNISLLMILLPNEGYLQLYLLPSYPSLPDVLIGVGLALNFFIGWEILVQLGGLGEAAPRVAMYGRRVIGVMAVPVALTAMAGQYGSIAHLVQAMGQIEGAIVILITATLVARGNRDARIFFLPYVTYLLLSMSRLGRNLGWFPTNALTDHGFHLGVLIQSVSLAAMATYRLHRLRTERQEAQNEQLKLSQRNERELESRVSERTTELTKAIEDQRQLLSMVSHEFRNPLAVVDGAAQNLARGIGGEAPLQQIRRAVERMSQLLVNVLAEDRLADNVRKTNMQSVDLVQLAREAVQFRTPSVTERMQLSVPVQEALVMGDPHLLRIALDNLLDNAVKYAPQGLIDVVVLAEARQGDDDKAGWLLAVRDRGPGIPPDTDVFAKYVRGAVPASTPGAGLGLFLVARIAELHEGRVTAKQRPGGGAEIGLVLPAA